MTLARFCFISSIPMLLVAGNPEAANITIALATDAPMQTKEVGTALTTSRHETILCCDASDESFRQITQAVSFQEFLSTDRFCLCKLIENDLADSEGRLTERSKRSAFVKRCNKRGSRGRTHNPINLPRLPNVDPTFVALSELYGWRNRRWLVGTAGVS